MSIRQYSFECSACAYKFDLSVDSEQIIGYQTKCPQCKKQSHRDYFAERVIGDTGPKTLGMLADLNTAKKKKNI